MLFKNRQKSNQATILYIVVCFIGLVGLYSAHYVLGQTMSSGIYKIQSDSVNIGGVRSTSSTYLIEDTAGETGTGDSASSIYKVSAGYQSMQVVYLAVTANSDVTMSPAIGGITGGTSNGSTNFTVTTDNPAGYTVTIKASTTPALQSPLDTISDYSATAPSPDFTFFVPSTASQFGFTVEGTDIANSFKDNGSACNTGSGDTADKCWAGLSTSAQTILNRTSANHPSGTASTLKFRTQSGSSHIQTSGTYVATTTITLLPL